MRILVTGATGLLGNNIVRALLERQEHAVRVLVRRRDDQSLADLNVVSAPAIQRRMLNHWDNLNGTIERGYAGRSLWQWSDLPDKLDPRSPTTVSYPSGNSRMNSCAPASFAAAITRSIGIA